jgi:tRNA A58 N-methylase Trm61
MKKLTKANFPRSFGVFSPTGHVVMAVANDAGAKQARNALFQNGFSEDDVTHYNKDEVLSEFEKSEAHAVDPIQIGQDVAKVEEYLELARQGSGFLIVHAPEDEEAKRAVRIAKPFGLKFAEKYNRLTLEELA